MLNPYLNKTLLWDVTGRCNLRCKHCYNADKYFRHTNRPTGYSELSTSEALDVVDRAANVGYDHIHLLGGEPFCRADLLQIIAHARQHSMRVTINTNGTLLNDYINGRLIELGVDHVTVSLDGSDDTTHDFFRGPGAFRATTENIRRLNKRIRDTGSGPKVQIALVITATNLKAIPAMPQLAANLGAGLVGFNWLYECGNACESTDILRCTFNEAYDYIEEAVSESWLRLPAVKLQLDLRPRFATYLSRKYCIPVIVNPKTLRCLAGEMSALLEADGFLHPCGALSTDWVKPIIEYSKIRFDWLQVRDVDSWDVLVSTDYWHSFSKFRDNPASYKHITTCRDCEHNSLCRPCPLLHAKSNQVEECTWVRPRERQLREMAASSIPRLSSGVYVRSERERPDIWDPSYRDYRSLNDTGLEAVQLVDGVRTCHDIAADVASQYAREDVGQEEIMKDIVHHLLDMRRYGLLEFDIRWDDPRPDNRESTCKQC